MSILEQILEENPDNEFLRAEGYDDAVIGYCSESTRLIYSVSKILEILQMQMEYDEAVEFMHFNILGAYAGEQTPIFCHDQY